MKTLIRTSKIISLLILMMIWACEVDPEPEPTDYSGTWNCNEQSSLYGSQSYQIQISNDAVFYGRIYLANFYNLGYSEKATLELYGFDVDIPSQTIAGKNLSGSGSILNSKKMEFTYVINDGIDADTVSSVITR